MNILEDVNSSEAMLFRKAEAELIPIYGIIEVSPLCNMNCDMCFVRLSHEEMESQGRLRTAEEWLQIAEQMKKAGVLFLLLTGGEPLLYPGFKELYLGLRKLGMILTINTNGAVLDEEWADFFAKYKPRRINITLYGADDHAYQQLCHYPGGFEKTMNAIRMLKERDVDVKLNYSLTRVNAKDLEKFIQITKELNVPSGINPYMIPAVRERKKSFDWSSRLDPAKAAYCSHWIHSQSKSDHSDFVNECKEKLEIIEKTKQYYKDHQEEIVPQRSSCLAGRCSFMLNWQVKMRPCVILTFPEVDVFENGFDHAWQTMVKGMEELKMNVKCTSCPKRSICDNCPAAAYYETGSVNGVSEYLCDFAEEKEKLLRDEVLKAQKDIDQE